MQAEQEVPTWLSDAAERAKQSALAGDDFNDIRKVNFLKVYLWFKLN